MAAILLVKASVIPIITAVRTTCAGDQYIVVTPEYTDVVTINGESITCTCGQPTCPHIQAVQTHRAQNASKNARRDVLEALFDLSYGDIA